MSDGQSECTFTMGSQKYKMNFNTMTQTNIETGSQREVRLRPVYRSPESMRPYLQLVSKIISLILLCGLFFLKDVPCLDLTHLCN